MNMNIFNLRLLKTRVVLFTLSIFLIGIWTVTFINSQGNVIGALVGSAIDLGKSNFLDRIVQNKYGKTGGYVIFARSTN